ncbi:protein eyes shut homolog [Lytechinus variegatus]|uniref:protein eyes shut homolog n=1 Tax=Lytechinus variegatus TaxID=7654 RepID=UPI001BB222E4|nr:protein eyes shut homolog [Lytechinus variegatus]
MREEISGHWKSNTNTHHHSIGLSIGLDIENRSRRAGSTSPGHASAPPQKNVSVLTENECQSITSPDGTVIQLVPKLIPKLRGRLPASMGSIGRHLICHLPGGACALKPCSNGGICMEEGNGYTCSCGTDFTGTNCETALITGLDIENRSRRATSSSPGHSSAPPQKNVSVLAQNECQSITSPDGTVIQLVPKLIPKLRGRLPASMGSVSRHLICSLPEITILKESIANTEMETVSSRTIDYGTTATEFTTTLDSTVITIADMTTTLGTTKITAAEVASNQDSTSMSSMETAATASTAKMIVTDPITPYKIFLADLHEDLNFTSIPSTMEASFVTYDTVEKKVYWTDTEVHQVYRAGTDGQNKEPVTHQAHVEENSSPRSIALAESLGILFIAKTGRMITTLDVRNGSVFPKNETDFVSGFASFPRALVVDEEQGCVLSKMGIPS